MSIGMSLNVILSECDREYDCELSAEAKWIYECEYDYMNEYEIYKNEGVAIFHLLSLSKNFWFLSLLFGHSLQ